MFKKRVKNVTFEFNEETGISTIRTEDEHITEPNPIIAWNIFWGRAEAQVRNEFKELLMSLGYNLMGEKEK